jgi:hypothetical protein
VVEISALISQSGGQRVYPLMIFVDEQISLDNFKSLRLHTLLTSAFSHKDANHLFHNMLGLYFFGSSVRCSVFYSALWTTLKYIFVCQAEMGYKRANSMYKFSFGFDIVHTLSP